VVSFLVKDGDTNTTVLLAYALFTTQHNTFILAKDFKLPEQAGSPFVKIFATGCNGGTITVIAG
jgi:hypothetical protein